MNGIYWLASYPKSGNTWIRLFLTNYFKETDKPADINNIETDSIASSRRLFDDYIGLTSSDLDKKTINNYRPILYEIMSEKATKNLFMKVHDAYTLNVKGNPICSKKSTKGVIYIIRNPLDVAVSFAHHSNKAIDKYVNIICDETHTMSSMKNRLYMQFPQLILSWSGHVRSWIDSGLAIHIVRYEDLLRNPYTSFKKILLFANIEIDENKLNRAIEFSNFDELKHQELTNGFREKAPETKSFFRKGKIGSYKEELTSQQIKKIIFYNQIEMKNFGYLDMNGILIF